MPPRHGFPQRLWKTVEEHPPPGLDQLNRWRSPLRGPWLTSIFGVTLLVCLPLVTVTGLLDFIAYGPQFGQAFPGDVGWLHLPFFDWPTRPAWLFRLTQGLHVGLGIVLVPVILAKLWSVVPKLFAWPPARSLANILERLSLLLLVGGILFEVATGVLNIQYDYVFGFSFYEGHYYGAWVFIGGFVVHVSFKFRTMVKALRSRSLWAELKIAKADTKPEPLDEEGLVAVNPRPATISRRGALGLVAGGALFVAAITAGQTVGGISRWGAFLLPRGRSYGNGPTSFQINRTAVAAGVKVDNTWRLSLTGGERDVQLDLATLRSMSQHTADLPLACVEGWVDRPVVVGRTAAGFGAAGWDAGAGVRACPVSGEERVVRAGDLTIQPSA